MTLELSKNFKAILADIHRDRLTFGGYVFTYLTQVHFNVIRFPTFPDRLSCLGRGGNFFVLPDNDPPIRQIAEKFRLISKGELVELGYEYANLVRQSQASLRKEFGRKIFLYRAVDPGKKEHGEIYKPDLSLSTEKLVEAVFDSRRTNEKIVEVELDVVSGWSLNGANSVYGRVKFGKEFDVDDILIRSDLFDGPGKIGPMESNELLVLNRFATGLMPVQIENIDISNLDGEYLKRLERISNGNAHKWLHTAVATNRVAIGDQAFMHPRIQHPRRWPSRLADWIEKSCFVQGKKR